MPRAVTSTYRAPPASFYAGQRRAKSPGFGVGISSDIERMQRVFPEVFAAWLDVKFDSKEHIAHAFGKDERTARNWLSGLNCPTGHVAAAIILRFSDLRQKLIERMAA